VWLREYADEPRRATALPAPQCLAEREWQAPTDQPTAPVGHRGRQVRCSYSVAMTIDWACVCVCDCVWPSWAIATPAFYCFTRKPAPKQNLVWLVYKANETSLLGEPIFCPSVYSFLCLRLLRRRQNGAGGYGLIILGPLKLVHTI